MLARMCILSGAGKEAAGQMGRNFLYVVIAAPVVGLGAAGFAYYEHKRNTLLEVNVGQHGISVQKN